jgi:cation transporter-like permease
MADETQRRILELLEAREARRARARRAWARLLPVLLAVVVVGVWAGIAWANHVEEQREVDLISCQYLKSMTGGDMDDCEQ